MEPAFLRLTAVSDGQVPTRAPEQSACSPSMFIDFQVAVQMKGTTRHVPAQRGRSIPRGF